jgi:hypothetical protein
MKNGFFYMLTHRDSSQIYRGTVVLTGMKDGTAARVRVKTALANAAEWKVEQIAQLYKRVYHHVSTRTASMEELSPAANQDDSEWTLSTN